MVGRAWAYHPRRWPPAHVPAALLAGRLLPPLPPGGAVGRARQFVAWRAGAARPHPSFSPRRRPVAAGGGHVAATRRQATQAGVSSVRKGCPHGQRPA